MMESDIIEQAMSFSGESMERIVSGKPKEEDISLDRTLRPKHLADYLGQEKVKDNLKIESLKHFKDDVREVKAGLECGIKIAGFDDAKIDDVLEFYEIVKVARTLQ